MLSFYSFVGNAQRVIDAKATPWAGGVCCVHGTRYVVQIEAHEGFDFSVSEVWLKNQAAPLQGQLYRLNDSIASIYFEISANSDPEYLFETYVTDVSETIVKPAFEGDALIILVNPIKEIRVSIEKFVRMPPIAYP